MSTEDAVAPVSRRTGRRVLGAWALSLALLPPPTAAAQPAHPGAEARGLGLLETVHLMLEHDPNLAVGAARVRASAGLVMQAVGRFDPAVTSTVVGVDRDQPLTALTSERTQTIESSVGMRTELRSGLSIEPTVLLQRSEEALGTPVNFGTVALTLRQPLLRGRGLEVNLAAERSARRGMAASRAELDHVTAERVLVVAARYWQLRAAQLDLDILRVSEESARRLLDTTRRLVAADVTPAAELVQLEANLAAKEAARVAGERALFVSRQTLGREIGLEPAAIRRLPAAADPFPVLADARGEDPLDDEHAQRLVAAAMRRRDDLRAARDQAKGAGFSVVAARNAARPQLDLVFVPSYSGLVEDGGAGGFFSPLYDNVPGASSSFGVSWSWPPRNREARGLLLVTQAAHAESLERVELVERGIGADVPAALHTVVAGALQLEKSSAAVVLFEQAVVNEEKKLQAGSSTLLDVINQRDRLTAAERGEVAAHLELALALLELRFQTGTLLPEAGVEALTTAHLTTAPEEVAAP